MMFIFPSVQFRLWSFQRNNEYVRGTRGNHRTVTTACNVNGPPFLANIKERLAPKLSPKNIGIDDVDWNQGHLTISVTSLDDLHGVPNSAGATIDDCMFASTVIGDYLDGIENLEDDEYTLEVTTPGTSEVITKDREFEAFKGFPVKVMTTIPVKGHTEFIGTLQSRTDSSIVISVKGRNVKIARESVAEVKLISVES